MFHNIVVQRMTGHIKDTKLPKHKDDKFFSDVAIKLVPHVVCKIVPADGHTTW